MTANTRYSLNRLAGKAWIGALIWLCAIRLHRLPFNCGRSALMAVGGLGPFGSLLWWSWIDYCIVRSNVLTHRSRWRHAVRSLAAIYILFMLLPMMLLMLDIHWVNMLPDVLMVWIIPWNLLIACFVVPFSIWMLIRTLVVAMKRLLWSTRIGSGLCVDTQTDRSRPESRAEVDREQGVLASSVLSRRRLLAGAACLPLAGAATAVIINKRQKGQFLVRRITMRMLRLPDRLRGLTISHVSDIHTGRFFRPEHLPALVDAVNALKSDLVAVTGDIIDQSNDLLPVTCDAIAQFEHRHGRYLVMGNHDVIDNSEVFVKYVSGREPNFLIDRHLTADIGGERIQIAGMGWPIAAKDGGHGWGSSRIAATFAHTDSELFTLGLVHHPHDFDDLQPYGVDLTLAGHTHGGLLMLNPPGSPRRIGVGSLMFHYLWGEYHRGRSALYVNSGVGNWFPVRVNAPAEIVQLQLV